MAKITKTIQSNFEGGQIGTLVVTWDLEIESTESPWRHPDAHPVVEECRSVGQIHRVELHAFDKWGVDLTSQYTGRGSLLSRLEHELLESVSDKSIKEMEEAV